MLVPVLGRPHRAQPLADSLAASGANARLVFLCSPDDQAQTAACEQTGECTLVVPWPCGDGDWARKINYGLRQTDEPYLFTGADDLTFTPGWARAALAALEQRGAGVVGTDDGANPMVRRGRHATHSLICRRYAEEHGTIDEPGLIVHEGYRHQWVDNELVQTALARSRFTFAADALVRHHHPIFDRRVAMDATYEKALSGAADDLALFNRRRPLWEALRKGPGRRRRGLSGSGRRPG